MSPLWTLETPEASSDPSESCLSEAPEAVCPGLDGEGTTSRSPDVVSTPAGSACPDPPEVPEFIRGATDSPMSPLSPPPFPIDPPSPEPLGSDGMFPTSPAHEDEVPDLSHSSGCPTPCRASDEEDVDEEGEPDVIDGVEAYIAYQKVTMFRLGAITQVAPNMAFPVIQEAEEVVSNNLCLQCSLACDICGLKGIFDGSVPPGSLMTDHEAPGTPLLAMVYPEENPPCPLLLTLVSAPGAPMVRQKFRVLRDSEATTEDRLLSWRFYKVDGGYWVWNPVCMQSPDGIYHPIMSEVDPILMVPDGE